MTRLLQIYGFSINASLPSSLLTTCHQEMFISAFFRGVQGLNYFHGHPIRQPQAFPFTARQQAQTLPCLPKPLSRFKSGAVVLDGCDGGCGGIWFDHHELAKVNREHPAPDDPDTQLRFDPNVPVDDEAIRACPRCAGVALDKKLSASVQASSWTGAPNAEASGSTAGNWKKSANPSKPDRFHGQPSSKPANRKISLSNLTWLSSCRNFGSSCRLNVGSRGRHVCPQRRVQLRQGAPCNINRYPRPRF